MRRLAALLALAFPAAASTTTAWELTSYADFIKGKFAGISLSREGRLTLAPKVDTVFTSDQPVIWSVAQGPDGTLYAATGHRGRIYRIDKTGKSGLYWTAEQPEIFAIAVDTSGAVYAGTSPEGKVYRIENGKAAEYFDPKARYIWALAGASDGSLYVGTGDKGKIFRVTGPGKGELWYDTGQSHVTGLAVDKEKRLLAGTEPNGLLYRISGKDKAFVLYDAALPEIRAIVPMPDGTVYAAALGGSISKRAQAANQATQSTGAGANGIPTITTTVTVEGSASEVKPPDPTKPQVQQSAGATTPATTPQVSSTLTPLTETPGVDKSAVYRINPDNTVETLWTSKDENVYDVLALEKQILFSTDEDGRIYGLSPDRRVTLVTQTNEGETVRLLPGEHSVLAATGNLGKIYRLGETPGASGSYEAPVHDSGTASRWGSLSWRADTPNGTGIQFRTRSGNSAKPDRTWSEWSDPLTNPSASRITSPNARYIQWKLEMAGNSGTTPTLHSVSLAYLPQNSPPVLKSINVITQAAAVTQAMKPSAAVGSTYAVTVTDTDTTSSAGTSTQTLPRAAAQQITLTWAAEDPDNDRLVYTLYFRGEDETQWKLLRSGLHDNSLTFDADVMADGKYYFRVVASDKESNPPAYAREATLISSPVMIDNTPPALTIGTVKRDGTNAHIEFEAADAASPLRRCEYSLDANMWVPMESADGVIDSPREKFNLDLTGLPAGEHLVVIRVADSANNTGTAKVVLK
jgi:hypothetical protein